MAEKKKADLEGGYTRIANSLLEALYSVPILNRESRVLLFIIRHTYGFNHKEREISNGYIACGTGIDAKHISKIIQSLLKSKLLKRKQAEGRKPQTLSINTHLSEWVTIPKNGGNTIPKSSVPKNGDSTIPQNGGNTIPKSGDEIKKDIKTDIKTECVGENGKMPFPRHKIFDRLWTEWSFSQAGKERVSRKAREEIEGIGYARMNDARLRYEQDLSTRTTKNNQPISARTWFLGGFRQYLPQVGENGLWRSITGKAYFGEERLD